MLSDIYYENPQGIIDEGDGTEQIYAKITASDTWYTTNSASLPAHQLLVQDGDDVKAIDCNL